MSGWNDPRPSGRLGHYLRLLAAALGYVLAVAFCVMATTPLKAFACVLLAIAFAAVLVVQPWKR